MVLLVVDTQKAIVNDKLFIWNKRYAECVSFDEAIGLMMNDKSNSILY